jgi:hypothetical protein
MQLFLFAIVFVCSEAFLRKAEISRDSMTQPVSSSDGFLRSRKSSNTNQVTSNSLSTNYLRKSESVASSTAEVGSRKKTNLRG